MKTDIFVTSFGPVSDVEMVCELKQYLYLHAYKHKQMHCNCMFSVPTASSHVDPGLHYSDIWAGCHYSSLEILIWLTIPDSEGPI